MYKEFLQGDRTSVPRVFKKRSRCHFHQRQDGSLRRGTGADAGRNGAVQRGGAVHPGHFQ